MKKFILGPVVAAFIVASALAASPVKAACGKGTEASPVKAACGTGAHNYIAFCAEDGDVYGTISVSGPHSSFTVSLQDHALGSHVHDFGPLDTANVRENANSIRVVNSATNAKSDSFPPCESPSTTPTPTPTPEPTSTPTVTPTPTPEPTATLEPSPTPCAENEERLPDGSCQVVFPPEEFPPKPTSPTPTSSPMVGIASSITRSPDTPVALPTAGALGPESDSGYPWALSLGGGVLGALAVLMIFVGAFPFKRR